MNRYPRKQSNHVETDMNADWLRFQMGDSGRNTQVDSVTDRVRDTGRMMKAKLGSKCSYQRKDA